MAYLSMNAKCFICEEDLGLYTGRGRWELADGKWICVKCAKKHDIHSIKIKKLTSEEVMDIIEGKKTFNDETQMDGYDSQAIYNIKGTQGKLLKVYEDKCIIVTKPGIGSFVVGNGSDGEKVIYYSDVVGVQFKKTGLQIGYLQLETSSGIMNNIDDNFFNENSFAYNSATVSNEKMEEVKNYILQRIEIYKNKGMSKTEALSPADEILKYKKLCDEGIITQEEFEKKKKQLLNL